jgi:hypothetical protein
VLAFMERLRVLDSAERWHELRALRNAVNCEYEEDSARLRELFDLLQAGTPVLLGYYESLRQFCADAYP